jgi:hypothetical protein
MAPRISMTVPPTFTDRAIPDNGWHASGYAHVFIPWLPGQCPFYTMTSDDTMPMRNLQ